MTDNGAKTGRTRMRKLHVKKSDRRWCGARTVGVRLFRAPFVLCFPQAPNCCPSLPISGPLSALSGVYEVLRHHWLLTLSIPRQLEKRRIQTCGSDSPTSAGECSNIWQQQDFSGCSTLQPRILLRSTVSRQPNLRGIAQPHSIVPQLRKLYRVTRFYIYIFRESQQGMFFFCVWLL